MGQFPKGLPKGLEDLFSAIERGDMEDPEKLDSSGSVEEITGQAVNEDTAETNRILREIVNKLDELPAAIWDEVEGR